MFVRGDNQRGACGASDALCLPLHEIEATFFDVSSIGLGGCLRAAPNLMLWLGWTKRRCILDDAN